MRSPMVAESKASMLSILNACPIGMVRIRNEIIEWANERLCRAVGYAQDELHGMSIRTFCESDDECDSILKKLFRAGQTEARIVKKDGSLLDVALRISPLDDDSFLATATDITKQKQAENMLRFTRFSVDHALDPIIWTNRKGEIVYVNEAACKSVDYSRDEFLSMKVFDIASGMSEEKWGKFWDPRTRGEGVLVEGRTRRKDGGTYPVEVSSKYLQYENNEYRLAVIRDISERRQTEDALRKRAAFLEALVDTSFDGILVVNSAGKKIFQNQKTAELWGIPQHILDRGNLAQVQHATNIAKDPGGFAERIMYLYAHPDEASLDEVELIDGTTLERYSSPVLGQDGEYYGRIWGFHDITERKRAEDALRESERRYRSFFDGSPIALMEVDNSAAKARVAELRASGVTDLKKYADEHPENVRQCLSLMEFVDVNKAALQLYEATDKEDFRQGYLNSLAFVPGEVLTDDFLSVAQATMEAEREQVYLTAKGTPVHIRSKWTMVPGYEEKCNRVLISDIDVTKWKEAEEALRKSEEKYRDIFERAVEGIFQKYF